MHWTDPFNDRVRKASAYDRAFLRLATVLHAEGWQPEDVEKLASDFGKELRLSAHVKIITPDPEQWRVPTEEEISVDKQLRARELGGQIYVRKESKE